MRIFQTGLVFLAAFFVFGACAPAAKDEAAPLDQRISSYLSGVYDSVPNQFGRESMVKGTQLAASVTVSAITTPTSAAGIGSTLTNLTTSVSALGVLPRAPAAGLGSLLRAPGTGSGSLSSAPVGGSSTVSSGASAGGGSGLSSSPVGGGSGNAADYGTAICNFLQGFVNYIVRCSTGDITVSNSGLQNLTCSSFVNSTIPTAATLSVPASVATALNCLGTAFQTAACTNAELNSAFTSCGSGS